MSWFGPNLEPGETVLAEVPGKQNRDIWRAIVVILLAIEWFVVETLYDSYGISRIVSCSPISGGIFMLAQWGARWRIRVTDRRLQRRRGLLLWPVEEIPLDAIESVRTEMGAFAERLVIRARGRETVIAKVGIDLAPIARALNDAKGVT